MLTREGLQERIRPEDWRAAEQLVHKGLLRELRQVPGLAEYMISQEPYPLVHLRATEPSSCDCGEENCRHLAAALLHAEQTGALTALQGYREKQASEAFLEAVESLLPEAPSLSIEPSIFFDKGGLAVSLREGEGRLYVVRHLPQFLQALAREEQAELSQQLKLSMEKRSFTPEAWAFLRILMGYVQALEFAGARLSPAQTRRLPIRGETALELLGALKGMRFRITQEGRTRIQEGIPESALPVVFYVTGGRRGLGVQARMEQECSLAVQDGGYVLSEGQLIRLPKKDRAMARVLLSQEEKDFFFPQAALPQLMSELLPTLMRGYAVVLDEKLERRMLRLPLVPKVYLDQEHGEIVAKLRFCYGDIELDPFKLKRDDHRLILHEAEKERRVLEALAQAGFRVRRGYVYLAGEEEAFRFLTEGVQQLGQHAELYLSQAFKRLSPRRLSLSGRLSGQGSGLKLELLDDGRPIEDLVPVLQAIRSRKQYFRYKDGSFIVLRESEDWQDFAQAALDAQQELSAGRDLSAFRAAYLRTLVSEAGLPVQLDQEAEELAEMRQDRVESPVKGLHPYQERGFNWLHSLHRLRMGGILADEMGLGKTVQTIAAILHSKRAEQEHLPSIIVMPTSLSYNWLAEFQRFAPELRVQIVAGSRQKRQQLIAQFEGPDAPDVLLTSYPLIRQDIDLLKELSFRYAVLDEAQFIKNSLSLSARAVKRLQARTRLALSGTPMENNVAELWSLFDFVLPGYLPGIRDFLRRYDQGRNAQDLLLRIRPFLMRRLKKDVMAELPDKIESVISVPMPEEQRRVYLSVLMQKRMRLEGLLGTGFQQGGSGELLSALMEMRQICCHPGLVLPGYNGEAGKMELLKDILPEAIQDGHRVLIFSQFTQMLKILRRTLQREGIESLYLDGDTKPKERQELADRFNEGHEPVFLISLKAGGTGLNLTGADMVIHYDPWWNPAAEDQAADRAHRLGQEKHVQVLRLVMHDSIEEQVLALGKTKRRLFEKLIAPGEAMPDKLTKEDILKLFSVGSDES